MYANKKINNMCNILITKDNGNVGVVSPTSQNQVLTSRAIDTPIWKKIAANNIADKTLTGNQFGILSMENFVENQFITNIIPNIIDTVNIKDANITNNKLQNAIITSDKLGVFSNLPVVQAGLTIDNIDDGAIEASKLIDNNIPVANIYNSVLGQVWSYYGVSSTTTIYQQILKSENILDRSIEDIDLALIKDNLAHLSRADGIEAAKAFFSDVNIAFQFQQSHLALDKIPKTLFNAEVQAAINKLHN